MTDEKDTFSIEDLDDLQSIWDEATADDGDSTLYSILVDEYFQLMIAELRKHREQTPTATIVCPTCRGFGDVYRADGLRSCRSCGGTGRLPKP